MIIGACSRGELYDLARGLPPGIRLDPSDEKTVKVCHSGVVARCGPRRRPSMRSVQTHLAADRGADASPFSIGSSR